MIIPVMQVRVVGNTRDILPIITYFCQDFDDQMSGFVRILASAKTAGTLKQLGSF